ncbi:response regulator [Natrarchaeobaculum aegyptiacum]|uniref:Response regulator n=1 Tax=Natrarchaeobaculum aegyptiacum TaxID=745377 RepID=A0A2Z2HWG7_9EURY|nr:response regulator [Natrarchaeobaculum aegyptiacum]ARS89274.1 response regulator [Natrarchaeobaculum aegyptiacum]
MSDHRPTEPVDILLVEDNPGDVRLTKEAFKSIDAKVEFHTVMDGKAATEYFDLCESEAKTPSPDLVLLDLNLPRMDGFTILELLRSELEYPPPPILVLSSSAAHEDVLESYDRAANAYLTKPDHPDEFDALAQAIEEFWIDAVQHPPTPA